MSPIKEAIEALPQLPAAKTLSRGDEDGAIQLGYTADQMREYALAALRSMPAPVLTAWGMPSKDGGIYDVITPAEHDKFEGGYTIPLYLHATPPPAPVLSDAEERAEFDADAEPMGFDLTRRENINVEPWSDYADSDTGHRWGGWLARAGRASRGAK